MEKGKFYIISNDPRKELKGRVLKNYSDPFEYEDDTQNKVEIVTISNYLDATEIYKKIRHYERQNQSPENLWYLMLLNQKGYEEFKYLRKEQHFKLLDLRNHNKRAVNLEKLEYLNMAMNGGAIRAKKEYYTTALDFWVSAVIKSQLDKSHLDVDLDGGTYNPISLETLENLILNYCGRLESYINKDQFVSSIEVDNGSYSGTFFVETINEYLLIDVHCP